METMSETETEMTPLHTRVGDASAGDVGWVWWMHEWNIARIIEDGDDLFVVVLSPDGSEWLRIGAAENDPVATMVWFEVSRPTYELDDEPKHQPTHTLTYRDGAGSWTQSWRMPLGRGEVSRAIFSHTNTLLKILPTEDGA